MTDILHDAEIDWSGERAPDAAYTGNVIAAFPRPGSAVPERDLPQSESLPDLLARIAAEPAREMVFDSILALGEIATWHGQPRSLKTWAADAAAIACASGTALFGCFAAPRARNVLLIQGEDHAAEIASRLLDLSRGAGLSEPPANIHTLIRKGLVLEDPEWQAWVIAEVQRLAIGLVIFDSFRSVSDLTDQGPHELRPVVVFLRRLIDATGCAVLLVHHDTKPQVTGGPDTRRKAQRASGGAVFSMTEAPVSIERIDDTHALFCPDGSKYRLDAQAVTLTLKRADGYARLTAEAATGDTAEDVALQGRILEYLRHSPGAWTKDVAGGIRARKQDVIAALERLSERDQVDSLKERRGIKWLIREASR